MSKPSDTDKRYQRYADIFDNPQDADVLERGERALHWEFMEAWNPREVVTRHARDAQDIARRRAAPAEGAERAKPERRTRTRGRSTR